MSTLSIPKSAPPPYSARDTSFAHAPAPPAPAPQTTAPIPLPDLPIVPALTALDASTTPGVPVRPARPPRPQPQRPSGWMCPKLLPSPWEKAPKAVVTNFRQGVREGGKSAWAEIREGMKAPVGLTWDGVKKAGPLGLVGGAVCGAVHLGLCPISATIVFINHSSRGIVRGRRATSSSTLGQPRYSEGEDITPFGLVPEDKLKPRPAMSTGSSSTLTSRDRKEA